MAGVVGSTWKSVASKIPLDGSLDALRVRAWNLVAVVVVGAGFGAGSAGTGAGAPPDMVAVAIRYRGGVPNRVN